MGLGRMLLCARRSISLRNGANVKKPARVPTAALGELPTHSNALAIVLSDPTLIPVFQSIILANWWWITRLFRGGLGFHLLRSRWSM